ncbi:MAG: glucosaminidase domain-containing protein [Leptolyngbyaceae bacterium]|nr:glucosaminidase domain-containing protein [Leptolyngbyaceae bacterium]
MSANPVIIANAVLSTLTDFNLFPSVSAAQAILESRNGESALSRSPNNNFFGFKAGSTWKGETVTFNTQEATGQERAAFRKYSSPLRSFVDRNQLFYRWSRYAQVVSAKTPEDQIAAIGRSGYATDPRYAEKLLNVLKTYNLERLDVIRPTLISAAGLFIMYQLIENQ